MRIQNPFPLSGIHATELRVDTGRVSADGQSGVLVTGVS